MSEGYTRVKDEAAAARVDYVALQRIGRELLVALGQDPEDESGAEFNQLSTRF